MLSYLPSSYFSDLPCIRHCLSPPKRPRWDRFSPLTMMVPSPHNSNVSVCADLFIMNNLDSPSFHHTQQMSDFHALFFRDQKKIEASLTSMLFVCNTPAMSDLCAFFHHRVLFAFSSTVSACLLLQISEILHNSFHLRRRSRGIWNLYISD